MKLKILHIVLLLTAIFGFGLKVNAQCDFFGTVTVVATGYTIDVGYSQAYILVEDNAGSPGNILELNSDGDFGNVDEGTYFIYAVNYSGAQPSELAVGETWTDLNTYSQVADNCFELSAGYRERAITVCSADDICFGNPIEIAVQDYTIDIGYLLRYILVNQADGSIVDFNADGSFSSTDYSNSGTYDVYALSTNDNDLISDLIQGMAYSDFSDLADATCARLLGPREVTVLDDNFVYVADGQSIEAIAFCEVDGWTHYSTVTNPHDFVFSIYKNTNDITATVYIDVAAASADYWTTASNSEYSTHTLRRSWKVSASGLDYDGSGIPGLLTNSVKVRFYYPAAEKTLLSTINDDFLNGTNSTGENATAYDHLHLREARWFKSNDGTALDLVSITTPEQITDAYSLTVVGDDLTTSNGKNYVELADITGFSGGAYAIGTGPKNFEDVLPVEYLSFKGFTAKNEDVLSWITATEINNEYFAVEVSTDMLTFSEIGRVAGNGNSNTQSKYTFINSSILSEVRYYRLKQVDIDGKYEYSNVIILSSSSNEIEILVSPNPFTDNLNLHFSGIKDNKKANIQIFNDVGQLVYNENTIVYPLDFKKIFLQNIPSGVYLLKVLINDQIFTFKIIKK